MTIIEFAQSYKVTPRRQLEIRNDIKMIMDKNTPDGYGNRKVFYSKQQISDMKFRSGLKVIKENDGKEYLYKKVCEFIGAK